MDTGLAFLPHGSLLLRRGTTVVQGMKIIRFPQPCLEMALSHVPRYFKEVNSRQGAYM